MRFEFVKPVNSPPLETVSKSVSDHFIDLPGWTKLLNAEFNASYMKELLAFIKLEHSSGHRVFPERSNVFKAFNDLDYDNVQVVVLGQDPYHGPHQAMGRSFAVPRGVAAPPSLKNILKELEADLCFAQQLTNAEACATNVSQQDFDTSLQHWVNSGVLLLNSVLTVRAQAAFSHRKKGWEQFTDKVIWHLGCRNDPMVFLLWGSAAQEKRALISNKNHLILTAPHPSPLSAHRGFFGCKHFSKTNDFLTELGKQPVQWRG